ncbi:hypothetical protein [Kribbella shirazensis]|uniref:Uncharacterized protein n=1 Tax=Kribbella shirazensis TaxID=1105143 RepID=A0A7X6A0T4_9ACTN|nr:hypothetical protein [Kribbella shirazensis]NIK56449.1 hypothetical protein [Kribbella shirazensis]
MRKPIVAGATALLAVAAAGLAVTGVVVNARPADAALGDVPADCSASTTAYRADLQRLTYRYSAQKTSIGAYANDNPTSFVPTAHQNLGGAGDDTVFRSTDYAAHPSQDHLYKVSREGKLVDGTWHIVNSSSSHISNGFASTRILAYAHPYLYRVTGSSLYRYTLNADGVPTAKVKLSGTAWNTVNTLVYERTEGTGTAAVDVLIGTKANGELKEWRIKRATPTSSIASTVLKQVGWAKFTSLSTGYCSAHTGGRVLLGITATGAASVHFDANAKDRDGSDIKGGSLGELGWTAKAYGQ